jgi:hypothetical protein
MTISADGKVVYASTEGEGVFRIGTVQLPECLTWSDVISKYNHYVSGTASWTDVINCYTAYVSHY